MRSIGIRRPGSSIAILQSRDVGSPPPERRMFERFKTEQLVELGVQSQLILAELINLSDSGARLRIAKGVIPAAGRCVSVRLLDRTILLGVTRWTDFEQIGVQFLGAAINPQDYLSYEDHGQKMFSMILQQQRRLSADRS